MRLLAVACASLSVAVGTSTAQNLLTNGSFNGNLNGWGYPSGTTYDPTLDATGTPGSGSAKGLHPAASGGYALYQCIAVTGLTMYQVGGKIFIPSGQSSNGYSYLGIQWYSGTDCDGAYISYLGTGYTYTIGSWVAANAASASPAEARSGWVFAEQSNNSSEGSPALQINFDDMFVMAGARSYSRWIPAVIHKDVPSKNAKWRSDVAVLNGSASAANLTITMHPTGGPVTRTTTLAGSSQLLLIDVAGWLGVTADSGPLEVVSDQDFFLSGRTYNQVDATHTYGQDYDGQGPSELLAAQGSAWLPQLMEDALFRTNIGITNTGTATANVTVTLYDANGNQVWSDTRDYASGGFYQYQQPYLPFGGIVGGFAKVTVNSGAGVVAYASVVDANTGDPTTITMKR